MKTDEFQEEIEELEEIGVIEREKTRDGQRISFTEDGLKATKFKIGLDSDMQLFLFQLMWNNFGDFNDPYLKLVKIAGRLRDAVEINILRTIEFNDDRLEGIEVKEDLPEDFLQVFDP